MGVFDKIKIPKADEPKDFNPISIFDSLTGTSGKIKEIWEHQADVLTKWHENRNHPDVSIELNTGRGKTLVGILTAQSLLHETNGNILYVCPDNQLVEQVIQSAKEINIKTATRADGKWINKAEFERCEVFCITNYDSIFNSSSVFNSYDISAVVFDDGHIAHDKIRKQFTITITKDMDCYREIIDIFNDYFKINSREHDVNHVIAGDPNVLLFVPFFEIVKNKDAIFQFIKNEIKKNNNLEFPARYILNKIDRCSIVISAFKIEIAPTLIPTDNVKILSNDVRRVYLSATLPSTARFQRVFGISNLTRIAPSRISGEPQRLFLFSRYEDIDEQRDAVKELIEPYKCCILAPSTNSAKKWCYIAKYCDIDSFIEDIDEFKTSSGKDKITLAARYDGIDFADDTCRLLVLDGVPKGGYLIEKFIEQSLKVESVRIANEATRITQAIGRIFRNKTDRGIVFIVGNDLMRWLRNPNKVSQLPQTIARQITMGEKISFQLDTDDIKDIINELLNNSKDWNDFYEEHFGLTSNIEVQETDSNEIYEKELLAFKNLWNNRFSDAANIFNQITLINNIRPSMKAWYLSLTGLSYHLEGDDSRAIECYKKAFFLQSELGFPTSDIKISIAAPVNEEQLTGIYNKFSSLQKTRQELISIIDCIKYGIAEDKQFKIVENSIKELGTLLGFESCRQSKDNIGPDVIWILSSIREGISIEVKSDKLEHSIYSKDDIGQMHNHSQWLKDNYRYYRFIESIAGRYLKVDTKANPSEDSIVIELEEFKKLANDLLRITNFYSPRGNIDMDKNSLKQLLTDYGLNWPTCITRLKSKKILDLQE